MNDILPQDISYWQFLEDTCYAVADQYAYQEIRFPVVEQTALFKRSIGEVTDIVEKEMYTFEDRNGDSLALRPEGTACCMRAGIQHGLLYNQVQRLFYLGPMFRHERPQKGRYRQFHQFGIEAVGMANSEIDAEVILLSRRLFKELNLLDKLELQINSLGTSEERLAYRQVLVAYLNSHAEQLDEDSQRRLTTNPLRILDSKNPKMQDLITQAPKLLDHIGPDSKAHFDRLLQLLKAAGVSYTINPALVRGLDYYSKTVFEWVTTELGAQGTVCAGGRYDALVEQLGGKAAPAFGFAMGLERIVLLLQEMQTLESKPELYAVLVGEQAQQEGLLMIEKVRDAVPGLCVEMNATGGSYKSQFKKADKSGATWAIIIGDDEITNKKISLKNLRDAEPQQQFSLEQLITFLQEN